MQLYSLKAVRTNLGLTLDEAAKLIGISKYTLFNYEHYKSTPNTDRIRKIEKAYGISYNEIRFVPNAKEKSMNKRHLKEKRWVNGNWKSIFFEMRYRTVREIKSQRSFKTEKGI